MTKPHGATDLCTDMVKTLPDDAMDFLTKAIQEFWSSRDTYFDSWHITFLSVLYKGKGDPEDLNNYRGICLKETTAKIMSIIISNCLLKRLNEIRDNLNFDTLAAKKRNTP